MSHSWNDRPSPEDERWAKLVAQHDAAIAVLRRLVVSIRLGAIDEAAVREAATLVGEDGGG